MKRALVAAAVGLVVGCAPASAAWDPGESFFIAQAQKGHAVPPPARAERPQPPREIRQERPDQRRDRMTEDERRSLHRDLDKANREIYGRPPQK